MNKRVLGVDLGLKRTGLAVSDALGISIRLLENLSPRSRREDVAFLVDLIIENEVNFVVIGYPVMNQTGDEGGMARRARGFAIALATALTHLAKDVSVQLVDERGTSKEALKRLVATGVPRGKRRGRLDGEAAALLIERFIDGETGEPIVPGDPAG